MRHPRWVRARTRVGNDGMTDIERERLARRYAETGGKKPDAETRALIATTLKCDMGAYIATIRRIREGRS